MVAEVNTKPSVFAVFRNRNFTTLWTGQLISTIGSSLTSLAASIVVYRLTGSALSVGLMLMATAGPSLAVGLFAGVFVDRMDRKRIMIVSHLVNAVLILLIPILLPFGIGWLYALVMLSTASTQFFTPAHASVLPEIASDEELAAANSFIAISNFGSSAIGYALAGLIASRFPIEWAFYLDSISFAISASFIALTQIKPLDVEGRATVKLVIDNMLEGIRFIRDSAILRSLFFVYIPFILGAYLWNTLLLPFAEQALGASEFEFGLMEGLTSVGFVASSFMMARLADRLREGQWIALGLLSFGAISAFYSRVTLIPLAIALVMLTGFTNAPFSIARNLLVQRNTTREVRGRVNSAFSVVMSVIGLLGMAAAGLADVIDVRTMVLICALLVGFAGGLALVLPGIGSTTAEWRGKLALLRAAPVEPVFVGVRSATLPDFNALVDYLPLIGDLEERQREQFLQGASVREVPQGGTVVRQGETGKEAFFILEGWAVAGAKDDRGRTLSLASLGPGDFFGEIAALTATPRTADVVAQSGLTLLQVPAENIEAVMAHPQLRYLFLSTLTERLARTHMVDLPRLRGLDQDALRELRLGAMGSAAP
jgi:CRP-like cAMP-binding protein/sugar phosphate permease